MCGQECNADNDCTPNARVVHAGWKRRGMSFVLTIPVFGQKDWLPIFDCVVLFFLSLENHRMLNRSLKWKNGARVLLFFPQS